MCRSSSSQDGQAAYMRALEAAWNHQPSSPAARTATTTISTSRGQQKSAVDRLSSSLSTAALLADTRKVRSDRLSAVSTTSPSSNATTSSTLLMSQQQQQQANADYLRNLCLRGREPGGDASGGNNVKLLPLLGQRQSSTALLDRCGAFGDRLLGRRR